MISKTSVPWQVLMFQFMRGIMPILNRNQALRLLKTCENIHLPRKFKAILDKYENDPESLRAAGLAYTVRPNRGFWLLKM